METDSAIPQLNKHPDKPAASRKLCAAFLSGLIVQV